MVQLISVQIFESSAVLLEMGKQESIAEVEVRAVGTLAKNRGACTLKIVLSSCMLHYEDVRRALSICKISSLNDILFVLRMNCHTIYV